MSRVTIPNGGVVKCDADGCSEKFTTYSVVTIARQQAAFAGWSRVKANAARIQGKLVAEGYGSKQIDLCPSHKPQLISAGVK